MSLIPMHGLSRIAHSFIGLGGPLFVVFLSLHPINAEAQNGTIETNDYIFSLVPDQITTSSVINLKADRLGSCADLWLNGVDLDTTSRMGRVSLTRSPSNFTGCPFPLEFIFPLGNFSDIGEYQIDVYLERFTGDPGEALFASGFSGTLNFEVIEGDFLGFPETPQAGSIQSGVGLIRGWACDAERVQIQFNNEPRIDVAYGSSRADTFPVCGDSNNGYGMVYAWGLLGQGEHSMSTFIDGLEVSRVEFEVNGLPNPFTRGLAGEYEIEDFPEAGQSVFIRWSEPDQNFVIVDHKIPD